VVNVTSIGAAGSLRIDDLNDVRSFNALAMQNSVNLTADLSADLIAKYNLTDTNPSFTADNEAFTYYTGGSADSLNITLSQEAAAYEDFGLTVFTGGGNDNITVEFYSDNANLDANWNADQAALKNVVISGGAGDDVIRAVGDGTVTIAGDVGDDTVYSDNSGLDSQQATWVFNSTGVVLNDLDGKGAGTSYFLGDSEITVTFSSGTTGAGVTAGNAENFVAATGQNGFSSTVSVPTTNGVATAAEISQAIKDAINNDAVLSKLLVATDGPNHALIVTSLVDGVYDALDLDVSIEATNTTDLTGTAFTTAQASYSTMKQDSTDVLNNTTLDDEAEAAALAYTGLDVIDNQTFAAGTADDTQRLATGINADVTTVTFTGTDEAGGDTSVTIDGVTVTLPISANLAAIVDNMADAYNASASATYTAVSDGATDITFTAKVAGAGALTAADFTIHDAGLDNAAPIVASTFANPAVTLAGVASDEGTSGANIISLGAGSDLAVLSTDANQTEVIYLDAADIGTNTVFNFSAGAVLGSDALHVGTYLTDQLSASTSTESQKAAPVDLHLAATVGVSNDLQENSVTVITDFAQDIGGGATETFANLTAAFLQAAINDTTGDDYGNIVATTLDTTAIEATLVGSTRNHIVLIESDLNDGEYKMFHLTDSNDALEFTTVSLVGTIDLGETAGFIGANFSIA